MPLIASHVALAVRPTWCSQESNDVKLNAGISNKHLLQFTYVGVASLPPIKFMSAEVKVGLFRKKEIKPLFTGRD